MKDHTGLESKVYNYNSTKLEEFNTFLYEICVYDCQKNQYSLIESKFFTSDKLIKDNVIRYKENNRVIDKSITLIGAPIQFITENNLSEYVKKSKRKNRSSSK